MTRHDTHRYLIAYDVPDSRRRSSIANALGAYGDRIQYSVFVVDAAPVRFARLRRRLEEVADLDHDSILYCDLGSVEGVTDARFICVGQHRRLTDHQSFLI